MLNSVDFTSSHHAARKSQGLDVLSLPFSQQIMTKDKEAVRRNPTKQGISDPQVLRARKAHVDVAKFSE